MAMTEDDTNVRREVESIVRDGKRSGLWLVSYMICGGGFPSERTSLTVRGIDELEAYREFRRITDPLQYKRRAY